MRIDPTHVPEQQGILVRIETAVVQGSLYVPEHGSTDQPSMVADRLTALVVCVVGVPVYGVRSDSLKEVSKSYKRALLRIHPDKHMDNESKHLRATEVFKYVSQAFNDYKKKFEK